MGNKIVSPSETHKAFRNEMILVMKKYSDNLSAMEMLALASHLVGQIIALQDQRVITKERALELVIANIETGNKEVIDSTLNTKGSA